MAGGTRRIGTVRTGDRRLEPAHAWRLFHHDHVGVRADGLLRLRRVGALRRRRRPDYLQAQRIRCADQFVEQGAVLLPLSGAAAGRDLFGLAHRQFALRVGDPGRALERHPHGRHRISDLSVQVGLLRHCRNAVRSSRRTARQSHRLCQSGDDVLDAFGRSHHHGGARGHGVAVRSADRHGGAAAAGGGAVRHHRILADHPGPAAVAGGAVRARRHRRLAQATDGKGALMSGPLLQADNLAKRFGGIIASDDLTLSVASGELHAVIGPNGAGKTTLIAQLSGQLTPDAGHIRFAGNDITLLPMHRRSALGLARSFQITSLFLDLSVLDNVTLAVQAHAGHSFRFWRDARSQTELRQPARAALARVGLTARADQPASALSHGEHRQLELAMALAGNPRLLLLDEPMAGLGPEESARMVDMLRALKRELTILLVEHDMEAVFALADRITVLVYGRVIASGAPADIRADRQVRDAY